ncbi:DUF4426 domain-containing protein [Dasania marina]|uniref:DUF4426 domain-containing protein n=1 Tax=Dasania marina TaxID=471499 RepID=UPI0030DBAE1D
MKTLFRHSLIMILALLAVSAQAEQQQRFGDYEVHYSVVNSTFITPEVAAAYQITRGKKRAFVNISIRKLLKDGTDTAKRALVNGKTSDMIHSIPLNFKEIIEQGAIYYIAEFDFNDKDTRRFDIQVQPDPNIEPYTLTFSQKIYVEL